MPIFIIFGLYKNILRYSGFHSLLLVSKAISIYTVLYVTRVNLIGVIGVPRTIGIIQPLLFLFLIISWRILLRFLLRSFNINNEKKENKIKTLVYGSGEAGRQLVKAMQESIGISIEGFLDDDFSKEGCFIDGKKIYNPEKLNNLIIKKNISLVLLALPSIRKKGMK